jgi:ankyrin repeat protein
LAQGFDEKPLCAAAANAGEATVQLLLEFGADVNTRERFGTALQAACHNIQREGVVKLLLNRGADVNARPADMRDSEYGPQPTLHSK